MKRNVVAKFLVLSITASMLLGSTPVFAEALEATNDQTQVTQEVVTEEKSETGEESTIGEESTTEEESKNEESLAQASEQKTTVSYRTHVQTYGWQDYVSNGAMSGTEGEAKRLEGINIKLENQEYSGSIRYKTHVQTYGWQDYVSDDAMSGTEGEAKRLEAIQIELTGEMAEHYDIYYRVHSQTYGWLGWAKNGEKAGTSNYAKRLEGIEIVLVEKGAEAPGTTEEAYKHPWIGYNTHVQTYGWQGYKFDGETAGTSGESKRLEGIQLKLVDQPYEGSLQYRTHVQTYGWQDWTTDGETSGTTGEAKRLEAIQIELTGEMAEHFDVYYRVHSQTYGWLGWAKNGEPAGTEGYAKRLEAIEVLLIEKGNETPVSAEEEVAQAQAVVDQAKEEYDAAVATSEEASAKISDGSYAFFESMGSTAALNALNNCKYAEYNKKGDTKDATSLENMRLAIEYLDEYLQIREQEGCTTEVKVSDSLMAKAQADVNASIPLDYNHPQQFALGENLAWGYRDPFQGWYSEKTICENMGLDPKTADGAGHYQNIINDNYTVTGFAVNQNGVFGVAHGQVFSFENVDGDTLYTVSEYKNRFMTYYDPLNNAVEATNAKKAALDEAQAALDNVARCYIKK